ncbi:hypothetical protein [Blastococcus saxobsidens]|uniref:Uncharacterized protein n=1 Tax=Blastococcus saxobsidens TaxID=138336 RepID=A0A4Q7Y438_9ACTN|nr:hypothetical protein [Blastococcus saxobsidens]RZU30579.1 hypothetical protein BKA19_0199 [Blastococcus saxobsidens]
MREGLHPVPVPDTVDTVELGALLRDAVAATHAGADAFPAS